MKKGVISEELFWKAYKEYFLKPTMKKKKTKIKVTAKRVETRKGNAYIKSGINPVNRILIATPSLGRVRMEWVLARYGQTIPMNWGQVQFVQFMNSFAPLNYSVPDAQNIIVKETIQQGFEWLLLIEDDTMPPADAFIRFNKYMRDKTAPIVSGLYFSKSEPSEPLVFRGRGTSVYWKWKFGDLVWCDGVPTGMLLIHSSILKALWDESPEYNVGGSGIIARRVFDVPNKIWFDEKLESFNTLTGTSDLEFCTRIMKNNIFEKAGWKKFKGKKNPFLVDTNIFCRHIAPDGTQYPTELPRQ